MPRGAEQAWENGFEKAGKGVLVENRRGKGVSRRGKGERGQAEEGERGQEEEGERGQEESRERGQRKQGKGSGCINQVFDGGEEVFDDAGPSLLHLGDFR